MTDKEQSFEEKLADLEQIVTKLEDGSIPLDEALNQFQAGVKLSKELENKLSDAEATVAKLMDKNGQEQLLDISEDSNDK